MTANKMLKSLAIGSVLSLATLGQAVAETTFRFAEATPNRGARADAVQYFADQLEAQSGGDLKMDIHWGGCAAQVQRDSWWRELWSRRHGVRSSGL